MDTRYNKVKAIICDLDGTLCLINGRNPYDAANCHSDLCNSAVHRILDLYRAGCPPASAPDWTNHLIILCSGRSERDRQPTLDWLKNHKIDYDYLFMRKTGDKRADWIVKKEILKYKIYGELGVDEVEFCLDDRQQVVDMWRRQKITCFQVAPSPD